MAALRSRGPAGAAVSLWPSRGDGRRPFPRRSPRCSEHPPPEMPFLGTPRKKGGPVMAAIGDVRRFLTSRHLVGYLGLDARVRQSGSAPARHGRISKQGSAEARHLLVEAAWAAMRTPGPLRAFGEDPLEARRQHRHGG